MESFRADGRKDFVCIHLGTQTGGERESGDWLAAATTLGGIELAFLARP